MKEIWKDINGYEGLYQVSNLGRVKSLERYKENHSKLQKIEEKTKVPSIDNAGYLKVTLSKDNKSKNARIHRLVAETFILNIENKSTVNHKNGVKTDNRVDNLEWCSYCENNKHAWNTGLRKPSKKQKNITKENNKKYKSKPIYQLDINEKCIKIWNNAYEASRALGINRCSISQCCNNGRNKTAGGYIWRFVDGDIK